MIAGLRTLALPVVISLLCLFDGEHALAAARSAASCSSLDVTAAVDSAVSGDTVRVPAGTCTWTSELTLPTTKDLDLIGAGSNATLITCSSRCLTIPTASRVRVSGFKFTFTTTSAASEVVRVGVNDTPGAGKTFRIDHNEFVAPAWSLVQIDGGGGKNTGIHATGLVDNNRFTNVAVHVFGTNYMRVEGAAQDDLWSQTTTLGDGVAVVYVEDNIFVSTYTSGVQNFVDGNYAARYVVRFNTMIGDATGIEVHSVQHNNRAVQRWEIYRNTFTKESTSWYPIAFIRAGTGVAFGNRVSATFTNDLVLDNIRSQGDPDDAVGACNGQSRWDQNSPGLSGYPCRDQIGRGRDNTRWTDGAAYAQELKPAYVWDNIKGTSAQLSVNVSGACGSPLCLPTPGNNPLHLVENRDWYRENTSFSGRVGVGRGTLASRPTTCGTGVAYWATDVGEWNSRQTGPDGELYKCTSENTWTLYYRPYVYPHPLQGGAALSPPSGLTVK